MDDDDSNSNETVLIENEEIDNILKKYRGGEDHKSPLGSLYKGTNKNIYNLDEFSDAEIENEPLRNRITQQNTNSWQEKFSTDDFCEDSNDFDAVLNRISQLENEQFHNEPRPTVSKEIDTLISGDIIRVPKTQYKSTELRTVSSENEAYDHTSNEFDLKSELDSIKNSVELDLKVFKQNSLNSDNSSLELSLENVTDEPKSKKIKRKNTIDRDAQKLEKELVKAAKAKEREQKKMEKENQKQLKNALKAVENCVKPDQCIQYLTVTVDENIANKHYWEVIKAGLKSGSLNYQISKQIVPNLISWMRKVPMVENGLLKDIYQKEKHYLLLMDIPEFIQHIVDHTITGHIQSLLSMPQIGHLSIAVLGLQRYYKYLRNEEIKEFKVLMTEGGNIKTTNTEFKHIPKIDKAEIEKKLVELQVLCKNIYIRPVEKFEDLAVFIGECTKSVAQIPYKQAKAESLQQENEFFTVDNRDCVKVDKDGNGLNRLWNQFLRMFPLASLETAEAVTSVYPTMHSLMEAYKNIDNPEDGEKLLQDLPVRRAAGPLGGRRRLGPEFSKKAYRFFWSEDNILL